jgi:hypothetical protein
MAIGRYPQEVVPRKNAGDTSEDVESRLFDVFRILGRLLDRCP